MATYEHNALTQYKEENGDMHIVYPITKAENVVGFEEGAYVVKTGDIMTGSLTINKNSNDKGESIFHGNKLSDSEHITIIDNKLSDGTIDRIQLSNINGGSLYRAHQNAGETSWTVYKIYDSSNISEVTNAFGTVANLNYTWDSATGTLTLSE